MSELDTLLSLIREVKYGDVVLPEDHNNIRALLEAIVERIKRRQPTWFEIPGTSKDNEEVIEYVLNLKIDQDYYPNTTRVVKRGDLVLCAVSGGISAMKDVSFKWLGLFGYASAKALTEYGFWYYFDSKLVGTQFPNIDDPTLLSICVPGYVKDVPEAEYLEIYIRLDAASISTGPSPSWTLFLDGYCIVI